VHGVLAAMLAKLGKLQPVFGKSFLVLLGEVSNAFAILALHFYQIVLRHKIKLNRFKSEPLSGFEPETYALPWRCSTS
jgi:hypothetical protein